MSNIDSLLSVAAAYGAALDIGLPQVSWRALGDSKKLTAIKAGKDIQVRRLERAMQWFSDNWPANAEWPANAVRPAAKQSCEQVPS